MNPDTNNEVARLRELLNRAIDNCECEPKCSSHFASYCDCGRYARNEEIRKELARLAPAPEEAAPCRHSDDVNCRSCHVGEVKEPVPEWRELGPDEVIQMDDMYRNDVSSRNYPVTSVMIGKPVGNFPFPEYSFRTRRPLPDPVPTQPPTQNEWRLRADGELMETGDQIKCSDEWHMWEGTTYEGRYVGEFWKEGEVRTRRPLPVQEQEQPYCSRCKYNHAFPCEGSLAGVPLEDELDYLTKEASRAADIHNHVVIVGCISANWMNKNRASHFPSILPTPNKKKNKKNKQK